MSGKRILLINPPQKNTLSIGIEDEFLDMIGYYPPLGLLYLATVLKQQGYQVKVIDCAPMNVDYERLRKEIGTFNPFLVGVTTFTTTMYDVLLTVNLVKEINKNIYTVIGGHHPALYPEESIRYQNVDFIMQGECENTFLELIQGLQTNKSYEELKKIDGIGFHRKDISYINFSKAYIKNLDELPIVDRSILPRDIYSCIVGKKSKVATVMSSRGCPFGCTFCYTPNKNYRSRSVENIIAEIEYLVANGFQEIFFFDDLFAIKAEKIIEFSKALRQKEIKVNWSFRARINTITPESISEIKRSGCHRIQFGIESASDKTLKRIKKDITTAKAKEAIALCAKHKITTIGSFMIGLPDEIKEDILETIEYSRNIGLDYAQYAILMPFPFTEVYLEGLNRGILKRDFWKEYAADPLKQTKSFKPEYWMEHVTEDDLFALAKYAFRKFYFRPHLILKRLREINSYQEFKNSIAGGLSVLKFAAKN